MTAVQSLVSMTSIANVEPVDVALVGGIVAAVLVAIVVGAGVAVWLARRRRRRRRQAAAADASVMTRGSTDGHYVQSAQDLASTNGSSRYDALPSSATETLPPPPGYSTPTSARPPSRYDDVTGKTTADW